jgi:hypothetical protein
MKDQESNREGRTIRKLSVVEGVLLVQPDELGKPVLGNTKATNSIPASHDFNSHVPSDPVLFTLPPFVPYSSLISIPDAREPLAGHLLLEDPKLADHPCEASAGEAAARETEEKNFVANGIIVHEKVVRLEDVMVDSVAKTACIGGYFFTPSMEMGNTHAPRTCLTVAVGSPSPLW